MEVTAGREAGVAHPGDRVTRLDVLAGAHPDDRQMVEGGLQGLAVEGAVVDDDPQAIPGHRPGGTDLPVLGGDDGRATGGPEIHPGVQSPVAQNGVQAVTEGRGHGSHEREEHAVAGGRWRIGDDRLIGGEVGRVFGRQGILLHLGHRLCDDRCWRLARARAGDEGGELGPA